MGTNQSKRPGHDIGKGPFAELQTYLMHDVSEEMSELGAGSYAVVKKIVCKGEYYAAKQLHDTLFNFASPKM